MTEARAPMGLRKDLHIKALLDIPEIRTRWKQVHGQAPADEDVQRMYDQFVPIQLSSIRNHTMLLPFVSVENGVRPKPFMLYRNLELMNIHPIQSVIKVDDTASGIGEALEAGCWGVGIARYSNYMNINSLEEAKALPQNEIQAKLEHARKVLSGASPHYVIDTFDQLPRVIDDVNLRLDQGEAP